MKWRSLQRVVFIFFVVLVIFGSIMFASGEQKFDLNQIQDYLKSFGVWAPIVFIILYAFGTIFIPSTPFMAASGILFGFKYGLLYTVIGGLFSSIFVFFISRKLGKDSMEKILSNKYMVHLGEYNKRLETGAIWDLILLRMTPIMPFNALNILMGVSRIKTRDYVIGTLIGLAPSNVLTVYFGDFLSKIFS